MSHEELAGALETLHRELADANDLDPADVEKLKSTVGEIQAALEKSGAAESTLSQRIAASADAFEKQHPSLTSSLGRIADMLQQMGI